MGPENRRSPGFRRSAAPQASSLLETDPDQQQESVFEGTFSPKPGYLFKGGTNSLTLRTIPSVFVYGAGGPILGGRGLHSTLSANNKSISKTFHRNSDNSGFINDRFDHSISGSKSAINYANNRFIWNGLFSSYALSKSDSKYDSNSPLS